MADDFDVEDLLEEAYNKKPSAEENGSRSDDRREDKKRHRHHSRSPQRRHGRRSNSRERRRSRERRQHRRSRSRSPRRRDRSRERRRSRRSPTPDKKAMFGQGGPGGAGGGGGQGQGQGTAPPMYRRVGGRSPEPEVPTEDRDRRTVMCMQLAAKVGPRHLEEFFQKVGQVREVKMIADKNSRRSKGIAYVEFHDESSVMEAMRLTGQKLYGVPIIVQPTMAEKNRLAAQAQNLMKQEGPRKVYVGNLNQSITDAMLKKIFEPFGQIEKLSIQRDDGGTSKGFGFIEFKDSASAERAVQNLNEFIILDRKIKVTLITENALGASGAMELLDGDEFQGGVGLTLQSRASLMAKLAETHNVGIAPPPPVTVPVMSSCFMLSNMFDPQSETETGWEADIRDDVLEECSVHGPVLHIHVDILSQGNVYVKCATPQIASAAFHALNGRLFSGKTIVAQFIPDETYHSKFPVALAASQPLKPQ